MTEWLIVLFYSFLVIFFYDLPYNISSINRTIANYFKQSVKPTTYANNPKCTKQNL